MEAPPPVPAQQPNKTITLRSYKPQDHKQAVELFAAGMLHYADQQGQLRKVWVDYVEQCIHGDLANIDGVYFAPGGHYWVATAEDDDGNEVVVGTVAVERKPGNEVELRRMSVKAEYRRYGVGRLLIANLEKWVNDHGIGKVWLSVAGPALQAQTFYKSLGFTHFKTEDYPPYFDMVFFEKSFGKTI